MIQIALGGCAGQAALIRELAKDKATFCADLTGVYLGASLRTRLYRTGVEEMKAALALGAESTIEVQCKDDGMVVKRARNLDAPDPK